jgi:hypothetical protein
MGFDIFLRIKARKGMYYVKKINNDNQPQEK